MTDELDKEHMIGTVELDISCYDASIIDLLTSIQESILDVQHQRRLARSNNIIQYEMEPIDSRLHTLKTSAHKVLNEFISEISSKGYKNALEKQKNIQLEY